MQAFLYPTTSQAKLASLNSKISSKETQIADIKSENVKLIASIANTTGGDIAINAGENVEIKAGTDEKTSHFYHKTSDFFSSDTIQKDKQTSQTISALIAGNNVNIHSDNDTTILASVITGGGDGDINAGGSLSVEFALNQYYAMDYHMETQMDVAALAVTIAVAVAVSVATAGAGAALMTSVVMSTALATSAATAALIAVGTQYGMSAAMSGGQHGTEAIQSGDADSTTTRSSTLITSSLLFGGNLTLGAGNNANTQTANIKADNVNQEVKQSSTTSQISTHTDIEPDYGSLVKDAAITGAIAGGTVVAGEYIKAVKAEAAAQKAANTGTAAKPIDAPTLKTGSYENSEIGKDFFKKDGLYYEDMGQGQSKLIGDKPPSGIWGNPYDSNPALKTLNAGVPGFESGGGFHDAAVEVGQWAAGSKTISIPPYFLLNYYAAGGGVGAELIARDVVTGSTSNGDSTTKSVLIQN